MIDRKQYKNKQICVIIKDSLDCEESLMYKPNPVDTKGVVLPEELHELTEKIAEN